MKNLFLEGEELTARLMMMRDGDGLEFNSQ